ncbi:MAG: Crp/Fnr family transcriptional regulator [Pseudomonadota bacterium]
MKRDEKDLLNLFRALPLEQQDTLIAFAEFLAGRSAETPQEWGEPEPIPRPAEEKVVHAIKRLRATYLMLDHSKMLYEVSECMTQHVVMGKPATVVIDELEAMFRSRFEGLKK